MSSKTVFTICAKNYIGLAQTLEKSVLKYNPEIDFFIFVVDSFNEDKVRAFLKDYMCIVRKHKMMFRIGYDEILLCDLETGTQILSDVWTDEVSVKGSVSPNEIFTQSEIEVK